MPNRTNSKPPLAVNRYGGLDVPLSVWTVDGETDLVAGLLVEIAPTGPVAAIDLPGWTAIPRSGRCTRAYSRSRTTSARELATLPDAARQRVAHHLVTKTTLAPKLRPENGLGMVCASSWLLHCPGGLESALTALKPGGVLAVLGRTDQDAIDIATLVDADTSGGGASSLDFTAYLIATAPETLDAAVRAAEGEQPEAERHWAVGIWSKHARRSGGTRA
ncbi:hypothetical protein [Glycomyces sp. MUSA5-2]|uniref:hypothetical protein n=1 Tax=Glycomyces sp. MUSA5-2 TaxID=2053002 RepID=UPI00300839E1